MFEFEYVVGKEFEIDSLDESSLENEGAAQDNIIIANVPISEQNLYKETN